MSIRTIRHYEEAGLIVPPARTPNPDLDRLRVVKPLGFTLGEMRDLLRILDELIAGTGHLGDPLDRLAAYHDAARARVQALRDQLATAEGFARADTATLDRYTR